MEFSLGDEARISDVEDRIVPLATQLLTQLSPVAGPVLKPEKPKVWEYKFSRNDGELARVKATEMNLYVDEPLPNELQVDIDEGAPFDPSNFLKVIVYISKMLNSDISYCYGLSKSGKGFHYRVFLPHVLEPMERVAYQALLGSDPIRELFNLQRVKVGDPMAVLFFEKEPVDKTNLQVVQAPFSELNASRRRIELED